MSATRKPTRLTLTGEWSATRAAREVVAAREDLLWCARSGRIRSLLIDHAAQSLPPSRDSAVAIAASDMSVPVTPDDTVRNVAERIVDSQMATLRGSRLYVLSPQMLEVVIAAAMTLDADDINADWTHLAAEPGMVLMPSQVLVRHPLAPEVIEQWAAISWSATSVVPHDQFNHLPDSKRLSAIDSATRHQCIRVREWGPTHLRLPDGQNLWIKDIDRARANGIEVPPLWHLGDQWNLPWERGNPAAARERQQMLDQRMDQAHDVISAQREPGQVVHDREGTFALKFAYAFLRLSQQQVAVSREQRVPLNTKVDGRRTRVWQPVNVVALRRTSEHDDAPERQAREVRWTHRWIVQMHKRRQWYPSKGEHEVIFVGPYVKGPDDAPLKPTAEQVSALVR